MKWNGSIILIGKITVTHLVNAFIQSHLDCINILYPISALPMYQNGFVPCSTVGVVNPTTRGLPSRKLQFQSCINTHACIF